MGEGGNCEKKEREWKRLYVRWDQGVTIEAVKVPSPHSGGPQPEALQLHSHLGQTQREGGPNPLQLSNKMFMEPKGGQFFCQFER